MGAWVEIDKPVNSDASCMVAPYVGAWDEMSVLSEHIKILVRRTLCGYVGREISKGGN